MKSASRLQIRYSPFCTIPESGCLLVPAGGIAVHNLMMQSPITTTQKLLNAFIATRNPLSLSPTSFMHNDGGGTVRERSLRYVYMVLSGRAVDIAGLGFKHASMLALVTL